MELTIRPALGITDDLYDALELAEQYAAAAYCPKNTEWSKETKKIECPNSRNCPKVESADTSRIIGITKFV